MVIASPRVDDRLFKQVVADVADGIIVLDASGTIVFFNPHVAGLLEYEPEELLERSIDHIVAETNLEPIQFLQSMVNAGGETDGPVEHALVHRGGHEIPVSLLAEETRYDGRRYFTVTVRDSSGLREQEPEGIETEKVLGKTFEQINDGIVVLDPDADEIVECNPRICEVLGYSRKELLALGPSDIHPHEYARVREYATRVLEDGSGWTDELSCQTRDGGRIPVEISASALEIGGRDRLLASVRDVSDRKAYEERLEALNEASRQLLLAETDADVAEIAVDLTQTVLDRSLTTLWTFDGDDGLLRPLAVSDGVAELTDADEAMAPIRPGTVEMAIFERGESRLLEEYGTLEKSAHPEMPLEMRLLVPLGEHGLFTVGSTTDDIDPSVEDLVGVLASTTQVALDHLAARQTVDQRSAAIDAATDGMGISDESGTFSYVNDAFAAIHGYEDLKALVGTSWERLYEDDEIERFESEILPLVSQQGGWRGEATGRRADGSTFPQGISLATLEGGGMVCIVRDITETKAQERQLESLNDVSGALMEADSREEIAQIGAEAVERVLGFEIAAVRLYDPDTNQLEWAALTDGATVLLESRTAYDLEATLAGRAFRAEEPLVNVVPESEAKAEADDYGSVFENSSFHVSIGRAGVLSVVVRSDEAFDTRDVHLAELLSGNVGTAIARAEREQLLRTHEREVRQHRDRLETMIQINSLFREIGKRLIEATTREELEQTICRQLARSSQYHSAWIGDVEGTGDRVVATVGSGVEEGYLNAIAELPLSSIANGTVARALETGEAQFVRRYQLTGDQERSIDDEHGEEVDAIAAIPILYGEHISGVLVVNCICEDAFSSKTIEGFESFGKMVGFALSAIRNRELLLSDSVVELEFTMRDPSVFYSQVTADLDCRLRFERSVQIEAGKVINYHLVEAAEPEGILEAAEGYDGIEDARAIADREDGFVLQTVTSRSTVHLGLEAGATLRAAEAADGVGTIRFEAPRTANVRDLVTTLEDAFEHVDLVAKRERERSVQTADEFRESVASRLTEKQLGAIESAYFASYYEWPRGITAEELAESMGISSSTLHQHLRKGIWSLLSAFFEEEVVD